MNLWSQEMFKEIGNQCGGFIETVNNVHSCNIVWHWNSNIIDNYFDYPQLHEYASTESGETNKRLCGENII